MRTSEFMVFSQFVIACLVAYSLYSMAINVTIESMLLGSRGHQQSLEVLESTAHRDMLNLHNSKVLALLMGDIKPRANIQ